MGGASDDTNRQNEAIMVIFTIICNVMSLAEEGKCGELFYNSKELKALRTTLREMGHP